MHLLRLSAKKKIHFILPAADKIPLRTRAEKNTLLSITMRHQTTGSHSRR
jgi:hypothetical protein